MTAALVHTHPHTQIHVFGNTGFLGAFHAAIAPISTKMIDNAAYEGQDVRKKVSRVAASSDAVGTRMTIRSTTVRI